MCTRTQIVDWLESEPQVSLAFEPGTLQIARGAGALGRLFKPGSALVVCNREEAAALTGAQPGTTRPCVLDGMLALGPEQVVITDGSAGAFGTDGAAKFAVPVFPDDGPVVDRTGAGDAFAGTLVAALAAGLPLDGPWPGRRSIPCGWSSTSARRPACSTGHRRGSARHRRPRATAVAGARPP